MKKASILLLSISIGLGTLVSAQIPTPPGIKMIPGTLIPIPDLASLPRPHLPAPRIIAPAPVYAPAPMPRYRSTKHMPPGHAKKYYGHKSARKFAHGHDGRYRDDYYGSGKRYKKDRHYYNHDRKGNKGYGKSKGHRGHRNGHGR